MGTSDFYILCLIGRVTGTSLNPGFICSCVVCFKLGRATGASVLREERLRLADLRHSRPLLISAFASTSGSAGQEPGGATGNDIQGRNPQRNCQQRWWIPQRASSQALCPVNAQAGGARAIEYSGHLEVKAFGQHPIRGKYRRNAGWANEPPGDPAMGKWHPPRVAPTRGRTRRSSGGGRA